MPDDRLQEVQSDSLQHEVSVLTNFIESIADRRGVSVSEILGLLTKESKKAITIPTSILRERKLGVLEAVVKYLKEVEQLRFSDIGRLLNRDDRVVWLSYKNASKKVSGKLPLSDDAELIPVAIFKTSSLGMLECIITYLVDQQKLRFKDIARLLNRDNRTVWASYHAARRKLR